MRIIGLDFGSKTVGVAISDELLITAQGIEIVRRKSENKLRQTLARIEELIKEYNVEKIVLGFPKNMNNSEGERCEKTLEFNDGSRNPKRESQRICGSDSGILYFTGIP